MIQVPQSQYIPQVQSQQITPFIAQPQPACPQQMQMPAFNQPAAFIPQMPYCPPAPCAYQDNVAAIARYAQPRYSGVSIEINEPQVKVPPQGQSFIPGQFQPVSALPQQSVYTCPVGSMYAQPMPQPTYIQQPVVLPPAPPVPQPAVLEQPPVGQIPSVLPVPVIENAPTVVYDNKTASTPETEIAPPVAEAKIPEETAKTNTVATIDIPAVITQLKSKDLNAQGTAMENMATTLETNPAEATQYLDTSVMESLVDVLNQDTTNLAQATPRQRTLRDKMMSGQQISDAEKAEASQLSDYELGERNKQYALYTIAMLQDSLGKEVEKTGTKLAINDLPAIESVIKTVKDNPNPMLRASAIAGLSYIAKPEYKPVLSQIFTLAKDDSDPTVQDVAKEALSKLEQPTATATASVESVKKEPSVTSSTATAA